MRNRVAVTERTPRVKREDGQKSSTFINHRGYIEQVYHDEQTAESVLEAIKQLELFAKKVLDQNRTVLIFIDVSQLTKIDLSRKMLHVRIAATKTMKAINFKKAAICAPLSIQILVNTMALVAGKSDRVKVFDNRATAIKWLLGK